MLHKLRNEYCKDEGLSHFNEYGIGTYAGWLERKLVECKSNSVGAVVGLAVPQAVQNGGKKMTDQEETKIVMDAISKQPLETVGHFALLKLAELGIKMDSEETKYSTEATFGNTRYKCKMLVTWEIL